jgi:hypothetical protein
MGHVAVLLAVALIAVGAASASTVTRAQYLHRVKVICTRAQHRLAALPPPDRTSLRSLARYLARVLRITDPAAAEILTLHGTDPLVRGLERAFRVEERGQQILHRELAALRAGDARLALRRERLAGRVTRRADSGIRHAGLGVCVG